MNAYQEVVQTRGQDWGLVATGARVYRQSRPTSAGIIDRTLGRSPFEEYEKQMQPATAGHQASLREIRKFFVFRNDTAVMCFLQDHRTIPQLLLEALPHLNKHFGAQTVFALKTLTDEDGSRELYAAAMWPGNAGKAIEALDNFNESWWIEKSRAAGGRLNFTYELE
jgi:hypothetical protein